mmetsp:Transcript_56457/g.104532  ORF Transcript_56457/g.104532 Transcript_56457/m.104532 type:complete len:208 (-) Transcript_56457:1075-1698(-)
MTRKLYRPIVASASQATLCTRCSPCSETAMSLHCPGCNTSTTSLKLTPNLARPSGVTHPRSPHIEPPRCAESHSEISRASSMNFFELICTKSFESLGLFVQLLWSFFNSAIALRSSASASCRVLGALPLLSGFAGFAPSLNFTSICRSRTDLVIPPGGALSLAFFERGGTVSGAAAAFLFSPPSAFCLGGRKQTWTVVHCGMLATSP